MEPNDPLRSEPPEPPRRAFGIITPVQLMLFGGGAAIIGGLLLAGIFMPGG